jgi:hypothetical protein
MMATDKATDELLADLRQVLARMNSDLDRVEILTGALYAFAHPIPEYEPTFQHLHPLPTPAQELGGD